MSSGLPLSSPHVQSYMKYTRWSKGREGGEGPLAYSLLVMFEGDPDARWGFLDLVTRPCFVTGISLTRCEDGSALETG